MENKAGFWHRGGGHIKADDMKNVFSAAWDCHATWLGCERLMVWERMSILSCRMQLHLMFVTLFFFLQFYHLFPWWLVGQLNASCHPLPVPLMPPSLFIFAAWIVKIVISAGNLTEGRGRLQVYIRNYGSPSWWSGTGLLGGTFEEGREVISDSFSKAVGAFSWQPSNTFSLWIDEMMYSLNKSGKSKNADMTDKH